MRASGKTGLAVKRTTTGTVGRNKITFTAKVPQYAQYHNEGEAGIKLQKLEFYSLNDENGNPIPVEVSNFNRVGDRVFKNVLSSRGIKVM